MKYIKQYAVYEAFSTTSLTEDQKIWLDKCAKGGWSLNPSTGLIDVGYGFDCEGQGLKNFKGVAFGRAKGNFYCSSNQLTSLEGAPKTVDGRFYCGSNQLTGLDGAPQTVGGYFDCTDNQLTSLNGAPQTVGGYFDCRSNQLTSLEGAPKTVNGSFDCSGNRLTSLEGAPQTVDVNFNCVSNQLTSLEGAPQTVGGGFVCSSNQLTSLEGAPKTVGWGFYCEANPVSEEALASIFSLMKKGKSYQQALEEFWPKMSNEDRILMYKNHRSLTPEEIRKYQALATVNRIKNYL